MQLIHPYVQKSSRTILPRRSASRSFFPPVWIQSRLSGNSGARTAGAGANSRGIWPRLSGLRGGRTLHEMRYRALPRTRTLSFVRGSCYSGARNPYIGARIWLQPGNHHAVARKAEEKLALAQVAGKPHREDLPLAGRAPAVCAARLGRAQEEKALLVKARVASQVAANLRRSVQAHGKADPPRKAGPGGLRRHASQAAPNPDASWGFPVAGPSARQLPA